MKISYNWMKEYGALHKVTPEGAPAPEDFAKKLDAAGYNVEGITYVKKEDSLATKDDVIIDVQIPRNRKDMMCMMWTAKELCGIYHIPYHDFALYGLFIPSDGWLDDLSDETDLYLYSTTAKCKMLCGRIVNHVEQKELPEWHRNNLIANGHTPAGSLVDIPVFVNRNVGQPMYFFDLDKLDGKSLAVEEATVSGVVTADGKEYSYNPGDVIIRNNSKVISICGVVVDDSVVVSESTKAIVIFSGVIDADAVRETALRLDVTNFNTLIGATGATASDVLKAVYNASGQVYAYSGGQGFEAVDIYNKYDMTRKFLTSTVEEINQLLSTNYTFEDIKEALDNPELNTARIDDTRISTMFPSYRTDNQVCDVAQSLLCYLGCDRIGEAN